MSKLPTLLELLQAGVHFGHRESRWHPKMAEFIFGARSGVHIIDLEKTLVRLEDAANFTKNLISRGGSVLFVGTKRQASGIIEKYAKECGMPYVTSRWLGGTLTNFKEVSNLIRRYHDLKAMDESGEMAKKYTKKECVKLRREIIDMDGKIGGIKEMKRLPDAIYIVDVIHEKTALTEANVKGIPVITLCDTNVNPEKVAYPIPSNDDAVKTIELMTSVIAEAVKEGAKEAAKRAAEVPPKAEVKKVEPKAEETARF